MVPKLKYSQYSKFEQALDSRDFYLTSIMVESILDAKFKNKTIATIFEVYFEDGTESYILTLKRKDWRNTLIKCLPDYEKKELYEKCAEMKQLIDELEIQT